MQKLLLLCASMLLMHYYLCNILYTALTIIYLQQHMRIFRYAAPSALKQKFFSFEAKIFLLYSKNFSYWRHKFYLGAATLRKIFASYTHLFSVVKAKHLYSEVCLSKQNNQLLFTDLRRAARRHAATRMCSACSSAKLSISWEPIPALNPFKEASPSHV